MDCFGTTLLVLCLAQYGCAPVLNTEAKYTHTYLLLIMATELASIWQWRHIRCSCHKWCTHNIMPLCCRLPLTSIAWGSPDSPAGHVPAPGSGSRLRLGLAVGHHPPQLRGLVRGGLEGGLLLPRHLPAAAHCPECPHPPHRLIWVYPLGSLLQLGCPLVPHLHPTVLLR